MACTALVPTARVVARPNPFTSERKEYHVGAGRLVSSVVRDLELGGSHGAWHTVDSSGQPLPCGLWQGTQVSPGDTLAVRAVPAGGGGQGEKDTLRTVASLAVVLGSIAAGGPLAGLLQLAGKVGTPMVRAGLTAAGLWAIDQAIPPPDQDKLGGDLLPVVNMENLVTPYAAVPRLYGKSIIYPRMGAQPYVDSDNTVRAVYVLGYGRLDVDTSTLQLGETLLDDIEGASYEIREGYDGDADRTLFPPLVADQTGDVQLQATTWNAGTYTWEGDFTDPISTAEETDEIHLRLKFPEGLGWYNDYESRWENVTASVRIQVRSDATGGAWETVDQDWDGYITDWEFTDRAGSTFSKAKTIPLTGKVAAAGGGTVDTPQQWDVRVKANFEVDPALGGFGGYTYTEDDTRKDARWTLLRSISWQDPIQMFEQDGIHVSTIGIRVPDDYAHLINRLSVEARSYLPYYESGAWQTAALTDGSGNAVYNNPAWVYADILRGTANTETPADSDVDGAALAAWATECTNQGFAFNSVFENQETTFRALSAVATIGRATFWMDDGSYSILVDKSRAGEAPAAFITPRNSWNFQASKTLAPPIHGLRCTYVSESNGWTETERVVYRDGYDADTATNIEAINFWGCTSDTLCDKLAWYYINCSIHRPETFTVEMDFEQLVFQRGDLVELCHDVSVIGRTVGRVKSYTDNGTTITGVTLDNSTTVEAGETAADYFEAIARQSDGTKVGPIKLDAESAGEVTTWEPNENVYLSPNPPYEDWDIAEGNLVLIGVADSIKQDCIVTRIEPASNETARVTLVPYAEAVYAAGTSASYEPTISSRPNQDPTPPITPEIIGVDTDEDALRRLPGGGLDSGIVLAVEWPTDYDEQTGAPIYHPPCHHVQAQYRRYTPAGTAPWQPAAEVSGQPGQVRVGGLEDGETYDVRLRAVAISGVATDWVQTADLSGYDEGVYVIGASTPPPDVGGLVVTTSEISWSYDDEPIDHDGFEVRHQQPSSAALASWDNAKPIHTGVLRGNSIQAPPMQEGTNYFYVKALDVAGNYSTNATQAAIVVSAVSVENEDSELSGAVGDVSGGQAWQDEFYSTDYAFVDGNGHIVPTTSGTDYNKFWAYLRLNVNTTGTDYTDVDVDYYIKASVSNAANWHIDMVAPELVHSGQVDRNTDENWIRIGQKHRGMNTSRATGNTYNELVVRVCVEAQAQALGRPSINYVQWYRGYPTIEAHYRNLNFGVTTFYVHPSGPTSHSFTHFTSCVPMLVTSDSNDTALRIYSMDYSSGYGPFVQPYHTAGGAGSLACTANVSVTGYRSLRGPDA